MEGNDRVADVEFANARKALTATGDAALVARVELTRCAARVAALVMDPCDGFDRLRPDVPDAERAYADYLAGRATPASASLLPAQHRRIASGGADPGAVQDIADPLARLVACGVLLRTGQASPQVLQIATDTAAHEGWRRPLLAWLGVQARRAEQGGDVEEAQRLRRRMTLVGSG